MAKKINEFQKQMRELRRSMMDWKDTSHSVTIYNCDDQHVCESCRSIEGDHIINSIDEINSIPEIPNKSCTCEFGCRCWADWSTAL